MDFVSRLKQYLSARGISVTQFADECQIPRPTASQLLAGRNKKVSDEIISKIHYTYPDVSITWLMFGEGDMTPDSNIKTSAAQNNPVSQIDESQLTDNPGNNLGEANLFSQQENSPEKFSAAPSAVKDFSFGGNTFSFAPTAEPHTPAASAPDSQQQTPARHNDAQITVTPVKGKSVTGIVVYYSDSTYESFIPDPESKHPFMR